VTFRMMTLRQQLGRINNPELCHLCYGNLRSLNRVPNWGIYRCGEPHHDMLHEALRVEKQPLPTPPALLAWTPVTPRKTATADLSRELLEGQRIDPDTMEVRARAPEPEKRLEAGPPSQPAGTGEQRSQRLSRKLLEAFFFLCQAGERFLSYIGEGRHQGSEPAKGVGTPRKAQEAAASEPEVRSRGMEA
jgi:hypothetical protein